MWGGRSLADSGWPATSRPGDGLGEGGGSAGEPAGREQEPGHLLSTGPCTRIWPAFVRTIGLRQTAQIALLCTSGLPRCWNRAVDAIFSAFVRATDLRQTAQTALPSPPRRRMSRSCRLSPTTRPSPSATRPPPSVL